MKAFIVTMFVIQVWGVFTSLITAGTTNNSKEGATNLLGAIVSTGFAIWAGVLIWG